MTAPHSATFPRGAVMAPEDSARKWWTLGVVCAGTFMLLLDTNIVAVALPSIARDLNANFDDLQWVIDAYSLGLAVLLLTAGALSDILGRRHVFVIGLVVFTTFSAVCGLAWSATVLDVARGLQAVGGAMMFATAVALLAQEFSPAERGTAFGVWGATTASGVASGPIIGGALTQGFGWQAIFYVNIPIGVVALVLALTKLKNVPGEQSAIDLAGTVTFSAALLAFVFALIRGNDYGWSSPLIIGLFVEAAVCLVGFVAIELLSAAPMLQLSLFRNRTFQGVSAAAFAVSGSAITLVIFITLWLQSILGYSPLAAGLRMLPLTLTALTFAPLAGRLSARIPPSVLLCAGLLLVGAGIAYMTRIDAGSRWTAALPGLLVVGAGMGLTQSPLAAASVAIVAPAKAGMASGINSTFRQVGLATGIAALGAIFAHTILAHVKAGLANTPTISQAASIASRIAAGGAQDVVDHTRGNKLQIEHVAAVSFTAGLTRIFLIAAALAIAGAIAAAVLVRKRDLWAPPVGGRPGPGGPGAGPPTTDGPPPESPGRSQHRGGDRPVRGTDVTVRVPMRERSGLIACAVAFASIALVAVWLDMLVVVPALPAIAGDFHASTQSLEWAVSAYALAFGVVLLSGRVLADRFGAVRMFVVGLSIFVAAAVACGLAPNVELFDAARALQGTGAALLVPLTFAVGRNAFSDARRELALGSAWGLGGLALLAGPVVGGVLAGEADWRWMFWIDVPIGIAALALVPLGQHELRGAYARIDPVGPLLAGAGLTGLLWGLTRGPDSGWTSHQVLPALGAGALLVAGFVIREAAAKDPILLLRLFREREFAAAAVACLCASFALFGSLFLVIGFLHAVRADSPLRAGLELAPALGAALLLTPVAAVLSKRVGARPLVPLGLLLQACALGWFAHAATADVSYARLIPGFTLLGAGVGLLVVPVARAVARSVRPQEATQASVTNSALAALGGAFGVAGLTAIFSRYGSYSAASAFPDGLDAALWVAAGISAAASVVAIPIIGRRDAREVGATVVGPRQPAQTAGDPGSTAPGEPELPEVRSRQVVDRPERLPEAAPAQPPRPEEPEAFPCPVCLGEGRFTFHPPQDPRSEICRRCY
ncbi:MAG: DHA2 family efflux MFS transporter permease subunit, partial [Actinobacteria bacterium]